MIEIVRVLVVTEQHGIHLADRLGLKRRAGQFFQLRMRQLIGPGRIEGRIGEDPKAVDFNQRGGTADQRDTKRIHLLLYDAGAAAGRVTR